MNADYIAGLEEAMRLLALNDLDFGPGRILKRIEQMKTTPDTTKPDRTSMSREQLESALAQREDQLRQVEAQCWAMREVLGSAITILDKCLTTDGEYGRELSTLLCRLRGAAKSTPSSILARLEEARWLLETETVGNEEWFKRRDSWLSGHTPTGQTDRAQLETARDLLSRCPGIRTDETREYWDEVQAFLGKEEV